MKLKLIEKRQESGNAWSFYLKPEEQVKWIAGQYLHYTLPHKSPDEKGEKRYFTNAAAPHEQHIQITTRLTGSTFKNALSAMNIGDAIEAETPEGDFIWQDSEFPTIFVAGGIGITPYRSILMDLHNSGQKLPVWLLYGNRDDAYIFKDELEHLINQHPEFTIDYITATPLDVRTIQNLVPNLLSSRIYYSGPEPMVEAIGDALKAAGLPEEQLKQDFFPGYDENNF